jgi:hypothetical protein
MFLRLIFRFTVFTSTLFVVLAVNGQVAVPTSTGTPSHSAPAPDLSKIEIPTVNFCDLVHNPEKFDKQILRTQAIIYYGFEASVLYVTACDKFDTWASYDSTYDEKAKEGRKLYKLLTKGKYSDYKRADVIIVGRFDGRRQQFSLTLKNGKNFSYSMGYGHLNVYPYQFTIMRVEKAKAVSSDVPMP